MPPRRRPGRALALALWAIPLHALVHLAGLGPEPPPLHPVIRGVLLTGGQPLYLTAHLIAGEGVRAQVTRTPPWPVDDKIVAEELSPYLAELNATRGGDE